MTHVRVKGFQIFKDRHGKPRCYHRASRIAVDLEKNPIGSAGFIAECARIAALTDKTEATKAGTLGKLIERYRAHPVFTDLAPRTKGDYQHVFDYLQAIKDTSLSRFNAPLVVKIRDKAAATKGRKWGNYTKVVLSIIFNFAVERGYMNANPARGLKSIKPPKGAPEANRPWTDAEREAVLAALPAYMKPPIALMMFAGIDPQDAVALPRSAIHDGMIDTKRGKTKVPVWVPMVGRLREILDAAPAHDAITVCATSFGTPWTVTGLRSSWRPIRLGLEEEGAIAPGLTFKGLRHTVANILAEMGKDGRTVADVLGQKTTQMGDHYSRRADRTQKVAGVVAEFEAEVNRRRTKIVKPPSEKCQTSEDGE